MTVRPSFEQTYPKHDFSTLVRLGILFGAWIGGLRRARVAGRDEHRAAPTAGGGHAATAA